MDNSTDDATALPLSDGALLTGLAMATVLRIGFAFAANFGTALALALDFSSLPLSVAMLLIEPLSLGDAGAALGSDRPWATLGLTFPPLPLSVAMLLLLLLSDADSAAGARRLTAGGARLGMPSLLLVLMLLRELLLLWLLMIVLLRFAVRLAASAWVLPRAAVAVATL